MENDEKVTKRIAAIEVFNWVRKERLNSSIAIAGFVVIAGAANYGLTASGITLLPLAFYFGYNYIKADQQEKYLKSKYGIG